MCNTNKNKIVRTRFAPSPTGDLHIGGARTALFNYLYAKHHNGKFVLRIEDTDAERNITDIENSQESELKKINIFPDESFSNPGSFGPYKQSQKTKRYLELAEQLIKEEKAYFCFCTEEELEMARSEALKNNSVPIYSRKCRHLKKEEVEQKLKENKKYIIRLKIDFLPTYSWNDMVRGKIVVPSNALGDFVIIRSNKTATYNFAVVVDDADMQISDVLRGEEHISNTPYQLAVYHALKLQDCIPNFGHISMVVDENREKLSKRNANDMCFLSTYRKMGYPPEAIVNFLALLSWSYGEEEIFNLDKIISVFDVSSLSKSPSVFDIKKLDWISHKFFQNMDEQYFLNFSMSFFDVDLKEHNKNKQMFALLQKNRITCADELNKLAIEHYKEKTISNEQSKFLQKHKELIENAKQYFPTENEAWDLFTIRNYIKKLMELTDSRGPEFFKPLRIAFCGSAEGFGLNDLLLLNGRDAVWKCLNNVFKKIHEK